MKEGVEKQGIFHSKQPGSPSRGGPACDLTKNLPLEGNWDTKGQVTPPPGQRTAQAGPAGEPCTVPAHSLPCRSSQEAGMHMVLHLAALPSSPLHSARDRYHFLLDDGGKSHLIPFKGPLRAIQAREDNDAITGPKQLSDEASI